MNVAARIFLRDLADLARRPGLLSVALAVPVVLLLLIGHLHTRDPVIVVAVVETKDEEARLQTLGRALDDLAGVERRSWTLGDERPWARARSERVDLVAEWIDGGWRFTTPWADRHRAPAVQEIVQDLALSLRRQVALQSRLGELGSLRDMLAGPDAQAATRRIDEIAQGLRDEAKVTTTVQDSPLSAQWQAALQTRLEELGALRDMLAGPDAEAATRRIDEIVQDLRDEAEVPTPVLRAWLAGRLQRLYPAATLADHALVPSYIALITVFLPFLFGATALVRERESGTLPMLILAASRRWRVLTLGKLLLPLAVALAALLLLLVAAHSAFGFGIKPGGLAVLGLQATAALASALLGLSLSTLVSSAQDAYTASAVYLVASILLTGMVYPVDQSAPAVAAVAYTFPLTWSGPVLEAWMFQGAGAPQATVAWLALALQCLAGAAICHLALRRLEAQL